VSIGQLFGRLKQTASINIIRHASQLLLGIIIARNLSVDDKGLHFIFTSLAGAIAILLSFGLINSIVFHAKKNYITAKQVVYLVACSQVILCLALGILLSSNWSGFVDVLFGDRGFSLQLFVLFVIYIVISLGNYFVTSYCLAFGLMAIYFFSFAVSSLISLAAVFIGLLLFNFDIIDSLTSIVLIEGGSGLLAFIFIAYKTIKGNQDVSEGKNSKDVADYAMKSYLGVSGSTIISQGDGIVLSAVLSHESLGLYSIAKSIYRLFVILPQTTNSVIFGMFCDLSVDKAIPVVKKICFIFFVISTSALVLGYFVLNPLIVFVYGNNYSNAYLPSMILLSGATLMASSSAINPFLLAFNMPLTSSKIVLLSGSVGLLFCVILSIKFGIMGAAISVLISSSITFLMRLVSFNSVTRSA
jgi:O-antigen/teichoic acid export membrane protein